MRLQVLVALLLGTSAAGLWLAWLVQHRHQLDPSERNARRVRDVISLLEEYGGFA